MCTLGLLLLTVDRMPVALMILWSQCTKTLPRPLPPCTSSEDCQWARMTTWCSWPVIRHSRSSQPQQASLSSPSSCLPLRVETQMNPGTLEASGPASHSCPPPVKLAGCLLFLLPVNSHFKLPRWFSAFPSDFAWSWHKFTSASICTLDQDSVCLAGAGAFLFPSLHLHKSSIYFTSESHLLNILGYITDLLQ